MLWNQYLASDKRTKKSKQLEAMYIEAHQSYLAALEIEREEQRRQE